MYFFKVGGAIWGHLGPFLRVRGAVGPEGPQEAVCGGSRARKPENKRAEKATFRARRAQDPPDSATFRGPAEPAPGKSRKSQKLHWYSERVSSFWGPGGPFWAPTGPQEPEPGKHPGTGPGRKGPKGPEKAENTGKHTRTEQNRARGCCTGLGAFGARKRALLGPFRALRARKGRSRRPRLAGRRVLGP